MNGTRPDRARHLHLIVAGLNRAWDDWSRQAPALAALFARGRKLESLTSFTQLVAQAFGVNAGIAAYALAGEGLDPGTDVWLRTDPVSLRFYQDRLILLDPRRLALQPEEAEALVQTLNRHFAADGLVIEAPKPERWYLRLPAGLTPPVADPADALIGRPLDQHLPGGAAAAFWRSRLTEAQMLLHDHPVNQTRESRGLPPINSIWFWGAGRWAPLAAGAFRLVVADHDLARALAASAGIECLGLNQLPALESLTAAMVIIELPEDNDTEPRAAMLDTCEARIFRPALEGLKRGRWHKVTVASAAPLPLASRLTPLDAWRFWRH